MLLVIDAGNTSTTFALFDGAEPRLRWRLPTSVERSFDEYASEIRSQCESAEIDWTQIDGIAIASVVPALNSALEQMGVEQFNAVPLFVDHTMSTGLKLLYDSPAELGADRIVDAVAAVAKYDAPCIVVDFGTATTFNAINAAGEFLGGAISPGLLTCSEALFARAAKLPRVEFKPPAKVIGSSTVSAIQSGLYHGYAGLVDGLLQGMIAEMGGAPRVIATGGLAPLIAGASQYIDLLDETLTLDGLRLVYEQNKP
jgi:type III pantothenate kinase